MDEHIGAANSKANITLGVKELVEGAVFDHVFSTNSNMCNDGHSRKTLYQCIRSHILCHMKEIIAKEVESMDANSDKFNPTTVAASTRKLLSSPEMDSVMCDVKQDIDDVLNSISVKMNSNIIDDKFILQKRIIGEGDLQGTGTEGTTPEIQNCLDRDKYLSCRNREGIIEQHVMLSKLGKASLAEVFETSYWINVRAMLKKCLGSENESVYFLALKLHARYLLSASNVAMYESFMSLKSSVENNFLFRREKYKLESISKGISLTEFLNIKLLKTMSLISEFFKDGSKKYVRLPLKLLEEIMENVVEMISSFLGREGTNVEEINTLHLFALIDPKARWAKRSFHHTSIRVVAFRKISESPLLVNHILITISNWFKDQNGIEMRDLGTKLDNSISGNQLRFSAFSHCLHIFCYCFRYKEGRNIYIQSSSGVTLNEILKSFIRFLNNSPQSTSLLHELFNKHIALFINHNIANSFYKVLFLEPLFDLYKNPQKLEVKPFPIIKSHVVNRMKLVLQSKIGLENLFICQRFNFEMDMADVSPTRIFLFHSGKCLRNYPDVPLDTLKILLDCCVLISRSPKGLAEIEESNIIPVLAALYCQLKGKFEHGALTVTSDNFFMTKDYSVLDLLESIVINLAAVSGRLWLIERERILFPVIHDFYKKPTLPWGCSWFQKLLLSSTLLNGGCEALAVEKVQRMALLILWKSWSENNLDHFSGTSLENLQSALNVFLSLCSALRGVKSLLLEEEGSEGTLVEGKNPPESLQELFEFTLGITEDPHNSAVNKQDTVLTLINANNCQELYLGLRLLRFMLSSLDTTLLLQHKFLIQEHLMKILIESLSEENGELMCNEITINCDQILKNCFFIESCYERGVCVTKTPRSSAMPRPECSPEQWTISWSTHFRSHSRRAPCRHKNGLVKFLGNTRHGLRDINWLSQLRKAFYLTFSGNVSPEIKCNVLIEIIEEVQKVYGNTPNTGQYKLTSTGDISSTTLFPEDLIGIKLAIRYGVKLNLLLSTPVVHSNFIYMLRLSHGLIKIIRNEFLGFDWFLATVFLICCGNIDRCQLFINNLLRLQVAPFLWVTLGDSLCSEHSGKNYRSDFLFLLIEQIELILSIEVPKVFAAFQLSSGSLAVLVYQWLSQCFWNVLEWAEIKNFLCIAIIHEPDYVVYYCVAVLLHLEPIILHIMSTSAENFWEQIKINPVTHFHLGKYVPFIEKLYKLHHNSVTKNLMKSIGNFSKSSL
ncbi:protein broad-minded-like [Hetaerina americana]|uniref:protein broad-minded-like n=1 Tax=Hetaerina americana TaxID=62018 RepID=UPI003A7F4599